jgi:hypothetical protein
MRPTIAADATVRALIAAVPDDRLRELFLELALAALAIPAVEEPKPAARNGRHRRGKGWRHGKGRHKIDRRRRTYLDALNASAASSVASHVKRRRLLARPNDAAANRRATAPRLTATARPSPPWRCGNKPASSSRGSPGAPSRANSASATGLLNSLTVT